MEFRWPSQRRLCSVVLAVFSPIFASLAWTKELGNCVQSQSGKRKISGELVCSPTIRNGRPAAREGLCRMTGLPSNLPLNLSGPECPYWVAMQISP